MLKTQPNAQDPHPARSAERHGRPARKHRPPARHRPTQVRRAHHRQPSRPPAATQPSTDHPIRDQLRLRRQRADYRAYRWRRGTTVVRTYVRTRRLMTSCTPPSYSGKADLGDLSGVLWPGGSMQGPTCPSECPSIRVMVTGIAFESYCLNWSGAKGTRTPGLLHAMRIRSVDPSPPQSNGEPPTCTSNLRQSGMV